jgi:hypothetical protein
MYAFVSLLTSFFSNQVGRLRSELMHHCSFSSPSDPRHPPAGPHQPYPLDQRRRRSTDPIRRGTGIARLPLSPDACMTTRDRMSGGLRFHSCSHDPMIFHSISALVRPSKRQKEEQQPRSGSQVRTPTFAVLTRAILKLLLDPQRPPLACFSTMSIRISSATSSLTRLARPLSKPVLPCRKHIRSSASTAFRSSPKKTFAYSVSCLASLKLSRIQLKRAFVRCVVDSRNSVLGLARVVPPLARLDSLGWRGAAPPEDATSRVDPHVRGRAAQHT